MSKFVSILSILTIILTLLLNSCKKDELNSTVQEESQKLTELTPVQKEAKIKLQETADILVAVLNEKEMIEGLAKLAGQSKKVNSISFAYLFHPTENNTELKAFQNPKTVSIANRFAQKFRAEVNKYKSTKLSDLEQYLTENACQLYMPYREYWKNKDINEVTIVADPIDNDDENKGTTVNLNGTKKTALTPLVTDGYAQSNPTLIVSPEDPDAIRIINSNYDNTGGGSNTGSGDGSSSNVLSTYDDFFNDSLGYKVYIKGVQFVGLQAKDIEGVFRGAIELVIKVGDAFAVNSTVANSFSKNEISRSDVNNNEWIDINFKCLSNWSPSETSVPFYAYESDGGNEITHKFSVGIDFTIPFDSFPVGFKTSYEVDIKSKSNDDEIGMFNYGRGDFIDEYLNHPSNVYLVSHLNGNISIQTYKNYEPGL